MNTKHTITSMTAVLAAGVSLAFLPPVHADTLTFTNTPASSVAAAMNKRYDVTIVFQGSANPSLPVTFSVDNPDTPDGRLQAVSDLASALDLDFQKVYVVSKVDAGVAVPHVPLDINGPIVFPSTEISAREAIQTVASIDNAQTQIIGLIDGNVTLPDTHMNSADAAAVIAKQTGTGWKAYYALFRRGETPSRFGGMVLDHTNGGQQIKVLPLLTFRDTNSTPAQLHSGDDAVVGPLSGSSLSPGILTVPNTNFGFAPAAGYGGFGFGDPYGYTNPYSPYGYSTLNSPYGYSTMNGGVTAFPGTVTAPGVTTTPVPNGTSTTILPSFPYMGSVGGQATVGGY